MIVNYRSSAREAEETADLCRSANTAVKVVQADVAIDADCRRLAAAASEWSRLDYWSGVLLRVASTPGDIAEAVTFLASLLAPVAPTDDRR
jgi:hypothetical protein